ncbi:MAG: hypothetical protein KAJ19_10185 [Gammaproteobacteria bacterium]|nr:hypothetical protein [Gammaproteobacteria bacterium]
MTTEQANAVFDILVEDCGACEDERGSFVHYFTTGGQEYRFRGMLGFGGKFRPKTMSVDYYPEDKTPERERIQATVNRKLAKLNVQVKP